MALTNHVSMPCAEVLVQKPGILVKLTFSLPFRVLVIGIMGAGAEILGHLPCPPWLMHLLWSLWLVRLHGPESHNQFPRNCGYSGSLTPQFCCQIIWSFQCQCPHPLTLRGFVFSRPHLLHWSCCHPGRWTCCLYHPHCLIQLAVLARWPGSWSGTLQCWS